MSAIAFINRLSRKQRAPTVNILRPTNAVDATGAPTQTYNAHLSGLTAMVNIISGTETVRSGRDSTRNFGRCQLQAGLDILTTDRLVYNSRTFDILHVRNAGERSDGDPLARMVLEIQETKP